MSLLHRAFAGLVLIAAGTPAVAEPDPAPAEAGSALDLSANVAIVSDYRYRGVSLSDRGPALQGGLDLETTRFFVGTLASTIADYNGSETELDIYAGLHGDVGSGSWYAGAFYYVYPGGTDASYGEVIAQAEQAVGPVTLGVQASYAPKQDNLDAASKYLTASAALEVGAGLGLLARSGYEDGFFYNGKWDWELGASYARGPFTASLSYVDTNYGAPDEEGRLASAGVVASLLARF